MLEFLVIATDKPNQEQIREKNREAHLAFLKSGKCTIKLAGPLLKDNTMIGSVLVIEADSLEVLQEFLQADPYCKAGLFANVSIQPMQVVICHG